MVEENQVMMNVKGNQETTKGPKEETTEGPKEVTTRGSKEVTTKGPKKVTTKDPKKIEVGNRLAEWNRKNRTVKKSKVSEYYGIGVVLAVGVIGGLGYYLYQAKVNIVPPQQPCPQTNKFETL